ncbi:hypothetical protein F5Y16DRAFT_414775 [Xylariaceae sp. FL0255]|nr:hypothetical protein F5Y16DRAFT_414775 [Xylariaceae sp. FL0255]
MKDSKESSRRSLSGGNQTPKVLRKLGGIDSYLLAMYNLRQYCGTSVSCRYMIPPSLAGAGGRQQLKAAVETAIDGAVLKHTMLQVGIISAESSKPKWVKLDKIDRCAHINWHFLDESTDLERTLHEVTASQLDAKFSDLHVRPGWKVDLLCTENMLELLFTWSHPHADGMSGKIFQQDILANLTSSNTSGPFREPDDVLEFPKSIPVLIPPVEKMMKFPMDFMFVLKTLWFLAKPSVFSNSPYLADWAPIPRAPYKSQFRMISIRQSILSNILSASRHHNTTLTGLLHALLLVSLASRVEEKAARAFTGATTVDMRRFLPVSPPGYPEFDPDQTMGNFVTVLDHRFRPSLVSSIRSFMSARKDDQSLPKAVLELLWSTATRVRGEIVHKLDIRGRNDKIGLGKFVSDWQAEMKKIARRPRETSWEVTGLGVLGDSTNVDLNSQDSGWSLQRAQFALSAQTTGAALEISPVSVAGHGLCVGVGWQDCVFDISFGESVTNDLERWLVQIGS